MLRICEKHQVSLSGDVDKSVEAACPVCRMEGAWCVLTIARDDAWSLLHQLYVRSAEVRSLLNRFVSGLSDKDIRRETLDYLKVWIDDQKDEDFDDGHAERHPDLGVPLIERFLRESMWDEIECYEDFAANELPELMATGIVGE